ncbi:MAG: hypothetical protein EOM92_18100 [Gammaproteobacteria bacterium]|nr:hypothetical protein [Gammaproteobacteria bacterium]
MRLSARVSRYSGGWPRRRSLSNAQAAEALGMTRRSIISYRTGSRPIPKTVWLACLGLSCSQGHPGDHGGPGPPGTPV